MFLIKQNVYCALNVRNYSYYYEGWILSSGKNCLFKIICLYFCVVVVFYAAGCQNFLLKKNK